MKIRQKSYFCKSLVNSRETSTIERIELYESNVGCTFIFSTDIFSVELQPYLVVLAFRKFRENYLPLYNIIAIFIHITQLFLDTHRHTQTYAHIIQLSKIFSLFIPHSHSLTHTNSLSLSLTRRISHTQTHTH